MFIDCMHVHTPQCFGSKGLIIVTFNMSGRKAHNELPLAAKVALQKEIDEGVSQRELSVKYNVSRKQI